MTGFASLIWLDLECADPPVLAEFYHQMLGWEVTQSHDEYAVITDGSTRIRLGRVDGYEAPGWPGSAAPKRYHLDLQVENVATAVERCLELGAAKPDFQPGGDQWTVLTDPAGHPFCLCPAQAPGGTGQARIDGQDADSPGASGWCAYAPRTGETWNPDVT